MPAQHRLRIELVAATGTELAIRVPTDYPNGARTPVLFESSALLAVVGATADSADDRGLMLNCWIRGCRMDCDGRELWGWLWLMK